jgi:hypothetical protein
MSHHTEDDKLSSLRARTDGQLIALIRKDLEEGLRLAEQGIPGDNTRARRAWEEASLLLPRVDGMSQYQHRQLNEQLERLRLALDAWRLERPLKVRAAGG